MLNGCHQSIRNTWGRFYPGSIRFFVGEHADDEVRAKYGPLKADEIFFPEVQDSYDNLIEKTIAIIHWAKDQNLDGAFLADNDSFVYPSLFDGVSDQDYAGQFEKMRYMHGGIGYYLSRKAIGILASVKMLAPRRKSGPNEDAWVGMNLLHLVKTGDIKRLDIRNFSEHHPDWCGDHGLKTSDVPKTGWQEKIFLEYTNGKDAGTNTQRES